MLTWVFANGLWGLMVSRCPSCEGILLVTFRIGAKMDRSFFCRNHLMLYNFFELFQLVGGFNPSENISQVKLLFPIYGKIRFMFQTTNQPKSLWSGCFSAHAIHLVWWTRLIWSLPGLDHHWIDPKPDLSLLWRLFNLNLSPKTAQQKSMTFPQCF